MKAKKSLAVLLSAAIAAGMMGCGSAATGSSDAGTTAAAGTAAGSAATSAAGDAAQSESTAAASNGELKHVVMSFPTFTGAPQDTQMVQDAMNEILKDKGIEIELLISDLSSYKQNMTLALSSGEQIDVMNLITQDPATLISQGSLTDLEADSLMDTYGPGIKDAIGQNYIDACRVNEKLYSLPGQHDYAQGRGCIAIGTEYLDGIGYKAPADAGEIIHITEDELNDILAQLHTKYPDMELIRPASNGVSQYTSIDQLGGNMFGVLLNYGSDLKVEDPFASDDYKQFCELMYGWNQKGYISADAKTDTTSVGVLEAQKALIGYQTGGKPGSKVQESSLGVPMTIFQTKEDFISSSAVASFTWAIPTTTGDAAAAMTLLNELYTNADLENLLVYGIKDKHYTLQDDGTALTTSAAGGTSTYGTLGWMAPGQFLTYVPTGNDPDLWTQTKTFNENSTKSKASGFTFDGTGVTNEIAAVQAVYDEYKTGLEYGFLDPATALPEMDKKMIAAGLQKIIDAKQQQLDTWATAAGVK
ncbi:MAG: ABC transporter substrate-binding protein [Lachnospiraceae bacterium]|jgi:putative aldouronate transport system substrate-binding protein|nr:ABC transporter substrate-binding protein [Lachnospiraceae bacterium]